MTNQATAIKLNTMPTSINDYDYYTQGSGILYNSSGETVDSPTIPNVTKVYVWSKTENINCRYTFAGTTSASQVIDYTNAVELVLTENADLTIYGLSGGIQ